MASSTGKDLHVSEAGKKHRSSPPGRDRVSGNWKRASSSGEFRFGLLVPMCGSAGIWGPSCISSAQTALAELNAANGIGGREVKMIPVDAAVETGEDLLWTVNDMIETGEISAIVGMHLSPVRQNLSKVIGGRIPYVYTPLYEGGETSPGVFAIGETPSDQLGPAISSITRRHKVRKWALIGNDYVWPRSSHQFAKTHIRDLGAEVVMDCYVPMGVNCFEKLIDILIDSGADAVVLSLIGQDAIDFNRAFGALDLDRSIIRLSCAIEENGLLAIGSGNTKRLYASSSYFNVVNTPENQAFKEIYHTHHGEAAPTLNNIGQSLYEGVHFLSQLVSPDIGGQNGGISYKSARGSTFFNNGNKIMQTYLARADGFTFDIVETFPGQNG